MFIRKKCVIAFLELALLFVVATAQSSSSSVSFAYPPTGTPAKLVVNAMDTVVFQWASNYQSAWLWFYCDMGKEGSPDMKAWANFSVPPTGNTSYSPFWNSGEGRDWNRLYVCHIDLNYENKVGKGINGPGLNITSVQGKQASTYALKYTTTGLAPSQKPPVTTIMTSFIMSEPSTLTSKPSTPTSAPPRSERFSTGAVAGIAVGAIIGVIALVVLGLMVWRKKRRTKKWEGIPMGDSDIYKKQQGLDAVPPYQDKKVHGYRGEPTVPMELQPIAELELTVPNQSPHELPGSVVSRR
ncbi:hypothetical protein GQ44DRAFT_796827 [Phaeosphaeriaceae sp. PMI808]|nr:hypothetical protein GQ44DRAFT_796827 [Phaeosphaeriaceae sp. PMI808]